MSQLIGISAPAPGDWSIPAIGWIFSLGIVFLGSAAGIAGPVLVNYIREYQFNHGVAKADAYSVTMYVMAVLLVIGLICNLLVRPVDARHHHKEDEVLVGGIA